MVSRRSHRAIQLGIVVFLAVVSVAAVTFQYRKGAGYNITDFGAVADGTPGCTTCTDNTTAINAALQAAVDAGGGLVHMPCGRFDFRRRIVQSPLNGARFTLEGEGSCTVLQLHAAADPTVFNSGASCGTVCTTMAFANANGVTLRHFAYDGQKTTQDPAITWKAVAINGDGTTYGYDNVVDGLLVVNPGGTGITMNRNIRGLLVHSSVIDPGTPGSSPTDLSAIAIQQSSRMRVANNYVSGSLTAPAGQSGIQMTGNGEDMPTNNFGGYDVVIADNVVDGMRFIGIAGGQGNKHIVVDGNTVIGGIDNAIDMGGTRWAVVTNNTTTGGRTGIDFDGASHADFCGHALVSGNTIRSPVGKCSNSTAGCATPALVADCVSGGGTCAGGRGISFTNAFVIPDVVIVDNVVTDAADIGINCSFCQHGTIAQNTVARAGLNASTQAGIRLVAVTTNTTVSDNTLYDDQGTATMKYGVEISVAGSVDNVVLDNRVGPVLTAPYNFTIASAAILRDTVSGIAFAGLPANVKAGSTVYCSDCTVTTAATCPATPASCICAGSGTGAIANYVGSSSPEWHCTERKL